MLTIAAAMAAARAAPVTGGAVPSFASDTVIIRTRVGAYAFKVEIADTPERRTQGLQDRRTLAPDAGMLFLFEPEQPAAMWMRNTYVPLDMLFIAADGTIVGFAEDTEPLSLKVIRSPGPVRAVLEVPAGSVRRLGIAAGQRVEHAFFAAGHR